MKGEITRKYLVPYPKSMTGKQVTGYDRSSLLGEDRHFESGRGKKEPGGIADAVGWIFLKARVGCDESYAN
jgi:hypothetical protein